MTGSEALGGNTRGPTRPRWSRRLHVRFLAIVSITFLIITLPSAWLLFSYIRHADNASLTARVGNLAARAAIAIDRHQAYAKPTLARDLLAPLASDRAFLCAELRNDGSVASAIPAAQGCVSGQSGHYVDIPIDDQGDWTLRIGFTDKELAEALGLEVMLGVSGILVAFLAAVLAGGVSYRFLIWRPLNRLSDTILRSARSGKRETVQWGSRDEIGLVVDAYNSLVTTETERERQIRQSYQRLQTSESALAALNQELELRVQDRTSELETAMRQADLANQSKTQFLWSMSHELRTPLNAIIGFSEIMSRQLFGKIEPGRYKEFADDILYSGQHLLKLINDLLDIARIEVGRESLVEAPTDIASLVAETLRVIRPLAEEGGVQLDSAIADDGLTLLLDTTKMQQILINLLSNAVKNTSSGGDVRIDVRIDPDARVAFRISDTGAGIPADQLSQVLEPFGRAEGPTTHIHKGTGLGLPLARRMTELHGGELVLDSEFGVGTCVTVFLPAARVLANSGWLPAQPSYASP
ncbi:MAG: ATP-binding protein [Thalassobaculaceae bacterium]|nr:ATP-binding protein [Thalassobaculaceae bacterium]